ncbi:ribonuclease H-like domain-containing protein [Tanacetum coccineum]
MYSVDLKNIVPKGGLTCLFAKATSDESKLWHRRLGHLNFKTMNKLVKGNLVRGLPSKLFGNDQTCVACQNGKQHEASSRTPQQNGVAERRNRTLIEAARTMLADSKLPTTFWAEAVNTCLLYHLGKFDSKAEEGFFVGYSLNSKAFRVFNSRTRIVEENLHIRFSESTPNVVHSLMVLQTADLPYYQDPKSSHDDRSKPLTDEGKKADEDPRKESECNLHYLRGNLHCFHLLLGMVGKSMYYARLQVEQLGCDASAAWHPDHPSSSTASKAKGTAYSISHYNLLVTNRLTYLLVGESFYRELDFDDAFLEEVGSHSFKGSDVLTVMTKFRECPFLVTVLATLGSDASIRKRALKLVYLLINETNVEPLTKGLIDYLEVSDQDFKGDLTAKICSIVEKLSPDKLWYIDQMLKVLCEWWPNGLGCVAENDAVDVIELAINRHTSDLTMRSMCLIALLKLSSRFPSCLYAVKEVCAIAGMVMVIVDSGCRMRASADRLGLVLVESNQVQVQVGSVMVDSPPCPQPVRNRHPPLAQPSPAFEKKSNNEPISDEICLILVGSIGALEEPWPTDGRKCV